MAHPKRVLGLRAAAAAKRAKTTGDRPAHSRSPGGSADAKAPIDAEADLSIPLTEDGVPERDHLLDLWSLWIAALHEYDMGAPRDDDDDDGDAAASPSASTPASVSASQSADDAERPDRMRLVRGTIHQCDMLKRLAASRDTSPTTAQDPSMAYTEALLAHTGEMHAIYAEALLLYMRAQPAEDAESTARGLMVLDAERAAVAATMTNRNRANVRFWQQRAGALRLATLDVGIALLRHESLAVPSNDARAASRAALDAAIEAVATLLRHRESLPHTCDADPMSDDAQRAGEGVATRVWRLHFFISHTLPRLNAFLQTADREAAALTPRRCVQVAAVWRELAQELGPATTAVDHAMLALHRAEALAAYADGVAETLDHEHEVTESAVEPACAATAVATAYSLLAIARRLLDAYLPQTGTSGTGDPGEDDTSRALRLFATSAPETAAWLACDEADTAAQMKPATALSENWAGLPALQVMRAEILLQQAGLVEMAASGYLAAAASQEAASTMMEPSPRQVIDQLKALGPDGLYNAARATISTMDPAHVPPRFLIDVDCDSDSDENL
ncbi:hypothetical protein CXG81DRAFT_20525 [Caulochytrium protostelioides]|uniref:Uncharacterized protein n=1 Tax=Caulochytrium protostelioides TaxID=1555241 RepID=A0A4P9X2Z2_9FUNG|nr:hypothetical protein CXG81DRAFT_20525 [Caulochytrium protostelioides]|eukprot:RKO99370.1 hypothetical protein CXG81DRAFT_20525 [Caulochytrium protostelioides]